MKEEIIAKKLSAILPPSEMTPGVDKLETPAQIDEVAASISAKQSAKEIARLKAAEKARLKSLEERGEKLQATTKELGLEEVPEDWTEKHAQKVAEKQKTIKALETLEMQTAEPLKITSTTMSVPTSAPATASAITPQDLLKLQGTTRPEIAKLLTALNINLSVQLTKQDTANLLACLLTCNTTQLRALMANPKIPLVIKTVIKRLLEDEKLGNIETIEKLWDRIFGKGPMQLDLPASAQLETGILPNTPVSREAYVIIRDTLIK